MNTYALYLLDCHTVPKSANGYTKICEMCLLVVSHGTLEMGYRRNFMHPDEFKNAFLEVKIPIYILSRCVLFNFI